MSVTSVLPHRTPRPAPPAPRAPGHRRLLSGVATALSTTLAGFGLSVLLLGTTDLRDADSTAMPAVDAIAARATPAESRLMRRFDCSTSGLPEGTIPGSALIREPDGRVHAVGFEQGWRIYRQHGPRTLVAVCLRPVR